MSGATLPNITDYLDAKCEECKIIANCHHIDILIKEYEKAKDDSKFEEIKNKLNDMNIVEDIIEDEEKYIKNIKKIYLKLIMKSKKKLKK